MRPGALSLLSVCLLFLTRWRIGGLFGASPPVSLGVGETLPLFLAGVLFLAYTRITAAGFYATDESLLSYILVYAEPLLLLVFLLLMPAFLGLTGVWLAMPASQMTTALIAAAVKRRADSPNACHVE